MSNRILVPWRWTNKGIYVYNICLLVIRFIWLHDSNNQRKWLYHKQIPHESGQQYFLTLSLSLALFDVCVCAMCSLSHRMKRFSLWVRLFQITINNFERERERGKPHTGKKNTSSSSSSINKTYQTKPNVSNRFENIHVCLEKSNPEKLEVHDIGTQSNDTIELIESVQKDHGPFESLGLRLATLSIFICLHNWKQSVINSMFQFRLLCFAL